MTKNTIQYYFLWQNGTNNVGIYNNPELAKSDAIQMLQTYHLVDFDKIKVENYKEDLFTVHGIENYSGDREIILYTLYKKELNEFPIENYVNWID